MSINYQTTYDQGFTAGQRLYEQSPDYRLAELRKIAEREVANQDLPMVLQVHYKDGFVASYGPRPVVTEKSSTEQKGHS